MKSRKHPLTRLVAPLAVAALTLGVAACSDDDGDEDDIDNPVDGVDDQVEDELGTTEVPLDEAPMTTLGG
jgi:hypothetical protein